MTEYNGAMIQYFHWYTKADGTLWKQLSENANNLAEAGYTSVWLPPAYKGANGKNDVGYGVYDLFDLGEFHQKDSVRTKYGKVDEYTEAIKSAQKAGLRVYADIVFNHKLGGDNPEEFKAVPYSPEDRSKPIGELQIIKAWTNFCFPGRKGKYSKLHWHWWHFNAADYNALDDNKNAVYLFEGKSFDESVAKEKGNYDFLMGCNLDLNNPDVQKELFYWGEWYLNKCNFDGVRFDAVKHVKSRFFLDWLNHLKKTSSKELFAVGEYWSGDKEALNEFISITEGNVLLFDVVLHYNFSKASKLYNKYDLRNIFDESLVAEHPALAVTMVSNHDSQPLQALESVIEPWFKPMAYALILLRRDGYPCVFYADYYGAKYKDLGKDGNEYDIDMASHQWIIDKFLYARRFHAYGKQIDYFDHSNCIGWIRSGNEDHPGGIAVLMSNGDDGSKFMKTDHPESSFIDITEHINTPVITDSKGWGEFKCKAGSVSVYIKDKIRLLH